MRRGVAFCVHVVCETNGYEDAKPQDPGEGWVRRASLALGGLDVDDDGVVGCTQSAASVPRGGEGGTPVGVAGMEREAKCVALAVGLTAFAKATALLPWPR